MAGQPITAEEIRQAEAYMAKHGGHVGRVNLSRVLRITEARAKSIIYKLRNPAQSRQIEAVEVTEDPLATHLRTVLKAKRAVNVGHLSERFDRSEKSIREALEGLQSRGFNVTLTSDVAEMSPPIASGAVADFRHDLRNFKGSWARFGAVGDNHLGNKHQRLDVLNAMYDLYADEGITTVFNTGNWIDGEAGKLNKHELLVFGLDAQVDYFCEHYPQRKGVTTYLIAGDDHEGWYQQRECIEIGRYAVERAKQNGRNDLVYLGYMEADVMIQTRAGQVKVRVMHPGGGSAYALSYRGQKMVEAFQGGEKPHILLQGHFHKFNVGFPREVWVVDTGTTCDQTTFMRKKSLGAMVGGLICDLHQDSGGPINRFRPEFIPFCDRQFYAKRTVAA